MLIKFEDLDDQIYTEIVLQIIVVECSISGVGNRVFLGKRRAQSVKLPNFGLRIAKYKII
jgi:hypothetical protein